MSNDLKNLQISQGDLRKLRRGSEIQQNCWKFCQKCPSYRPTKRGRKFIRNKRKRYSNRSVKKIKSDLTKALKTERILGDNPDLKPEKFSIDLTFLRGVRFEEEAKTYAQYINEAIDIGLRVEEETNSLQNWDN